MSLIKITPPRGTKAPPGERPTVWEPLIYYTTSSVKCSRFASPWYCLTSFITYLYEFLNDYGQGTCPQMYERQY
jgi:hypothetical protein